MGREAARTPENDAEPSAQDECAAPTLDQSILSELHAQDADERSAGGSLVSSFGRRSFTQSFASGGQSFIAPLIPLQSSPPRCRMLYYDIWRTLCVCLVVITHADEIYAEWDVLGVQQWT